MSAEWMSKLPRALLELPIDRLVLPATHDSGAYKLNVCHPIPTSDAPALKYTPLLFPFYPIRKFVENWTCTQSLDIFEQLKLGIRCLDFRVARDRSGNFWLVHALSLTTLADALSQIRTFLNLHPTEIVIIRLSPGYEQRTTMVNVTEELKAAVLSSLGTLVYPNSGVLPSSNECLKANRRALVFYSDATAITEVLWPLSLVSGFWANTDNIATLKSTVAANLPYDRTPGRFREVSFTLTPTAADVKSSIVPWLTCSNVGLKTYAEESNALLEEMVKESPQDFSRFSFITMDHPTPEAVETIINLNHL